MTQKRAEILLLAVIIARSTSFLFNKWCIGTMGVFSIMSFRYVTAFLILAVIFRKRLRKVSRKTFWHGFLTSLVFFAVLTAELNGVARIEASRVCLLENLAVVIVPLCQAVLSRKRPAAMTMISALFAVIGVALLTGKTGFAGFSEGEIFSLLAAALYAGYIMLNAHLVSDGDSFELGILQNGFLALFATIAAIGTGSVTVPSGTFQWMSILALAVVCSVFGLTFQPVAQSHIPAERAGLFCAVSTVSASALSVIFLHETMTPSGVLGAAMILLTIFLPQMGKVRRRRSMRPSFSGSRA